MNSWNILEFPDATEGSPVKIELVDSGSTTITILSMLCTLKGETIDDTANLLIEIYDSSDTLLFNWPLFLTASPDMVWMSQMGMRGLMFVLTPGQKMSVTSTHEGASIHAVGTIT